MFNASVMQADLESVSVQLLKENLFHDKRNFYEHHIERTTQSMSSLASSQ